MMSSFIDDIKNAFRKKDNSLNQIIFINIFVFLVGLIAKIILKFSVGISFYKIAMTWVMLPADLHLLITRPWTLFSYFVLHEDPFHILFNLLAIYWFGQIIGDLIGSKRVTSLYIYGGLMGGLFYLLAYNLIPYLQFVKINSYLLGASAGTNAIIMAAATLVPDYTIPLFLFGPVRLRYVALASIVISLLQISSVNIGGGIAHFGGMFIGYLFIVQLKKGNDIGKPINATFGFFQQLFRKDQGLKVTFKNPTKVKTSATPSQAEIDAILDKISQTGYDSLTKDEKQKLFHASQSN